MAGLSLRFASYAGKHRGACAPNPQPRRATRCYDGFVIRPPRRSALPMLCAALAACVPEGPATVDAGAPPKPAMTTPARPKPPPAAHDAGKLPPRPPITEPFEDSFDRVDLGPDWRALHANWRIVGGRLCGRGVRNKGVWLMRKLPVNARIEFDAFAETTDGDLKVELWGDGASGATGASYVNATSYIAILGGWKNTKHVLARLNEHGDNRLDIAVDPASDDERARPVAAGQPYHFKVERADGKKIEWSVNGIAYFEFTDPEPLSGSGHEHLGFNDWEVPVCFDNLKVTPL
jgi:hypothetical protein